jgi:hypothetical protein
MQADVRYDDQVRAASGVALAAPRWFVRNAALRSDATRPCDNGALLLLSALHPGPFPSWGRGLFR